MLITVLLVDDNQPFRQGVRTFLELHPEFSIVGEANDGAEGLTLAENLQPQVVVMDWVMPQMYGIQASRQLKERMPQTHVIILSMHADRMYMKEALSAGVSGYVLKQDTVEHLARAINAVVMGKKYFSPGLTEKLTLEDEKGKGK